MEVLSDTNDTWLEQSTAVDGTDSPAPFNVLFACPDDHVSDFQNRLRDAGIDFETGV